MPDHAAAHRPTYRHETSTHWAVVRDDLGRYDAEESGEKDRRPVANRLAGTEPGHEAPAS